MRQQPYEHLLSTQNIYTQCTATCGTQNTANSPRNTASNPNSKSGLSSLLSNASNLSKFGGLLGNILKNNNQGDTQTQNNQSLSQTTDFGASQMRQTQNKASNIQQNEYPQKIFSQPNAITSPPINENCNEQNSTQSGAQNFPTTNPQYALETLLHPQNTTQAKNMHAQNVLQDNKKCVLRQIQLHNDYLSRIPHN